jgi:transposase
MIHSWRQRWLRDLDLGAARVWIGCRYRRVYCRHCGGYRVEDLRFFEPYQRVTLRLARYIHALCKVLTVRQVATHLGLDWKTVKQVDRTFLEATHGQTDYTGLRLLAVDEVAVRKGHSYMTVVLDYETGRVLWLGRERTAQTLQAFFGGMSAEQKQAVEAIAMDMWDPYIKAVREAVPHVKIVFDLFHAVVAFNRIIDKVRLAEFRKARAQDKPVFKGSKYLLLANRRNIRRRAARAHLKELLELNQTISTVMILKEELKRIWGYRSRPWAARRLHEWCALAQSVDYPDVRKFARRLQRYTYGILNHCDYPIHTSQLEGVINKIKLIKRQAYGFHDQRYFSLKVIQAFATN